MSLYAVDAHEDGIELCFIQGASNGWDLYDVCDNNNIVVHLSKLGCQHDDIMKAIDMANRTEGWVEIQQG